MSFGSQLTIEVLWQDDDIVEIEVTASNSDFSAKTQVYTVYSDLNDLAAAFSEFPRGLDDLVEFKAGDRGWYSYFSLRAYCFNRVGHSAIQTELESKVPTDFRDEEKSRSTLEIHFESSAAQGFALQLK